MLFGLAVMGISLIVTGTAFQNPSLGYNVLLVSILAYIAGFALSIGVVIWAYLSEIFPNRVRGKALSIATMVLWLSNVVITQTFPMMMEKLGGKTFYMYSGICFVAFVFILTMVSETKGKTLEEIEGMWR
jgi:MFS family permease